MNILVPDSWLREFVETDATPEELQKYLSLSGPSVEKITKKGNEAIYEIEVTTNRIDMASIEGIAKEAASILEQNGKRAVLKEKEDRSPKEGTSRTLKIEDPGGLLPRALAVVIEGVDAGPSPSYIRDRLEKSGVRSLNKLIDITNYVMLEVGHPAHVFDYDRIKTGTIKVRHAKKGETIVTLDGKKYPLTSDDVIFEDGTGRIIDLPGIMGLENSVVTPRTKTIVFWIESNNPATIRKTSMRLGIRTMAAAINEKDPDPTIAKRAILRGISMFENIAGGKVVSPLYDVYPKPKSPTPVKLPLQFINERLGIKLTFQTVKRLLESLSFQVEKSGDMIKVTAPAFRTSEIRIPEDIVEEVARIYGYHNLPTNLPPASYVLGDDEVEKNLLYQEKVKHYLKDIGLSEVMNYSMISADLIQANNLKKEDHLEILNPTSSDLAYMRTHLTPSLIENIRQNEGKRECLRFFELAKTYKPRPNDLPLEEYKLGIVTNTDMDDLKGIIGALFSELNIDGYQVGESMCSIFEAKARISVNGRKIGDFGKLKKAIQSKQKIASSVYLAVFDFSSLVDTAKTLPTYHPINPYAIIKLDLTIKENPKLPYEKISEKAHLQSKHLGKIEFLGRYKDSYTLRFYFSAHNHNLTEKEAIGELNKIKTAIE